PTCPDASLPGARSTAPARVGAERREDRTEYMAEHKVSVELGEQTIIISTGKMAKLAGGSALVQLGGTVVLVAASAAKAPTLGRDFVPLTVDYRERTYAAGRIPGGFFKREGRPTEKEVLSSRQI